MSLEQFVELVKSLGPTGIVTALVVLTLIYIAKFSGLIKNGNVARIVNVVLGVLFAGYQFGDQASAFVAAIASLGSALLYTLLEVLISKLPFKRTVG